MKQEKLRTIDGATLMSLPLRPPNFVVDTLLSQGLHVLAGSPKEKTDDVFSRISGTTAISGAVDSSFTLVEEQRGSGRARLFCIGRDIEYRELKLRRNADNVWEVTADSLRRPELLEERILFLISELLCCRSEFTGTPTELAQRIDPDGAEGVTPKNLSRKILQSVAALSDMGITAVVRRSNGKRLVELRRADSADNAGAGSIVPVDPPTT